MDRAWTGLFFQFHLPEWQDARGQRRIFRIAYGQFLQVARQAQPAPYVTGHGWRTSRTKILDNAIIGFGKLELGEQPIEANAGNQITFTVTGPPPIKGEALSIFNPAHGYTDRVRQLLEAARQACAGSRFAPVDTAPVSLAVVLHAPDRTPGDATNYLGGIADVLEHKAHRGTIDHLGVLMAVWLYRNDRQIKEVSYREVAADEVSYTVTVRELGH